MATTSTARAPNSPPRHRPPAPAPGVSSRLRRPARTGGVGPCGSRLRGSLGNRGLRLGPDRYRLPVLRLWRMIGRDGSRAATVLNPARAKVETVPVKMLVVVFGARVSTG